VSSDRFPRQDKNRITALSRPSGDCRRAAENLLKTLNKRLGHKEAAE